MSFRRRLIVLSAAAVAIAIVLASVIAFLVVRDQLRGQVDASLQTAGQAAATRAPAMLERRMGEDERFVVRISGSRLGGAPGLPQLVAENGTVLDGPEATGERLPVSGATQEVAGGEREPFFEDAEVDGTHVRLYTDQIEPGLAVQIARPLDEVDRSLRNLGFILAGVSLGGVGLAAGLGLLLARATLRPVERLTDAAEHVTRTRDLSRRIDVASSDELGRLAASFNTMLAALEDSQRAQRQLVADASHELRTPLTSLRTNIELLDRAPPEERRRMLADVTAQLEEFGLLVGDLVEMAREEQDREPATEEVRLDRLAAAAVQRARRRTPGIRFGTRLEPYVVEGVPARIDRALSNLLDNAAKWSPPGGVVEVRLDTGGELTVRDHGPGIDPADLPHIFDRFYRSPSARGTPGSGLGLAIVRQVAESHGGSVTAESNGSGGALLRLRL